MESAGAALFEVVLFFQPRAALVFVEANEYIVKLPEVAIVRFFLLEGTPTSAEAFFPCLYWLP